MSFSVAMPSSVLKPLTSVKFIPLPCDVADNGNLVVMEGLTHVPFIIARVFVVNASAGAVRGQHAHVACTQFFTCPSGSIEVVCSDGFDESIFVIDRPDVGLLVPYSIWATQTYQLPNSVLTVLCDHPYDPGDYIRDFSDYKRFRAASCNFQGKPEK